VKRLSLVLLGLIAGLAVIGGSVRHSRAQPSQTQAAGDPACLQASVAAVNSSGIQGTGSLCWGSQGVTASLSAGNLTPGSAYTIWFAYWDNPATCKSLPCGDNDAGGDNPAVVFGRMDGAVADASGQTLFTGTIRDLQLSKHSEVQLVMFGHGLVNTTDNRFRARQLLTPQEPALGAPMGGAVADGSKGAPVSLVVFDLP